MTPTVRTRLNTLATSRAFGFTTQSALSTFQTYTQRALNTLKQRGTLTLKTRTLKFTRPLKCVSVTPSPKSLSFKRSKSLKWSGGVVLTCRKHIAITYMYTRGKSHLNLLQATEVRAVCTNAYVQFLGKICHVLRFRMELYFWRPLHRFSLCQT